MSQQFFVNGVGPRRGRSSQMFLVDVDGILFFFFLNLFCSGLCFASRFISCLIVIFNFTRFCGGNSRITYSINNPSTLLRHREQQASFVPCERIIGLVPRYVRAKDLTSYDFNLVCYQNLLTSHVCFVKFRISFLSKFGLPNL